MAKSTPDQLPAKLWRDPTISAPPVKDVLIIVAEFLSSLKYKSSYTALLAEAKSKGIDIGKKDWAGKDHKSLLDLLVASHKPEQGSKGAEEEDEEDEDSSDSDSDDSDSSEDDEEEEVKKSAKKPEVNGSGKRKREMTPSSSDDDSSEASSDSDSDSDRDAPPAKKAKAEPAKSTPASKAQPAKKPNKEDSSASDSSSSSDSDSDSESDSDSSPPPKSKKTISGKAQPRVKESSTSSNGSSSSATLVEVIPTETPKTKKSKTKAKPQQEEAPAAETPATNGEIHPDRLARIPNLKEDPSEQPNGSASKFVKKTNVPFSRISPHQKVDARFASNEYVSYDYADRAYQDLVVTKGKGFTKEKNKKKRGSYRGGMIDLTPKGIKFDD